MTTSQQPSQGPPAQYPYPQQHAPMASPKNGLGTTALVLGILGALFSLIPFVGVIAWPLVILGLIFGIIGFVRARSGKATNGGMAIAGTILSVIGLIICIIYVSAFSAAVADLPAAPSSSAAGQQPAGQGSAAAPSNAGGDVVVYEVSGSGTAASVTYIKDKNGGMEQQSSTDLPFRKEIQFDGGAFSFQVLSLTATNGQSGGEITCKITKNGQEVTSSTSSGPFASATCSGS